MSEYILKLEHISKAFEGVEVLKDISLDVKKGEFITFLGPSGCGKTTTLKIVSGLLDPDEGRVVLHGQDVTELPPEKRNVNTVFQSYALFPQVAVDFFKYRMAQQSGVDLTKADSKNGAYPA